MRLKFIEQTLNCAKNSSENNIVYVIELVPTNWKREWNFNFHYSLTDAALVLILALLFIGTLQLENKWAEL